VNVQFLLAYSLACIDCDRFFLLFFGVKNTICNFTQLFRVRFAKSIELGSLENVNGQVTDISVAPPVGLEPTN
jgi:hypothetical protein